jgi:hypothetical protein
MGAGLKSTPKIRKLLVLLNEKKANLPQSVASQFASADMFAEELAPVKIGDK